MPGKCQATACQLSLQKEGGRQAKGLSMGSFCDFGMLQVFESQACLASRKLEACRKLLQLLARSLSFSLRS